MHPVYPSPPWLHTPSATPWSIGCMRAYPPRTVPLVYRINKRNLVRIGT